MLGRWLHVGPRSVVSVATRRLVAAAAMTTVATAGCRDGGRKQEVPVEAAPAEPAITQRSEGDAAPHEDPDGDAAASGFRMPSGGNVGISCVDAHRVVLQVKSRLPYVPEALDAKTFAGETASWLDPHGFLSYEPDSPVNGAILAKAPALLRELERPRPGSAECARAAEIAVALEAWVKELRRAFDDGARGAGASPIVDPEAARQSMPDNGPVLARVRKLGERRRSLPANLSSYGDVARARLFPELDVRGWTDFVLASELRAWVPLVDAHSNWAPLEEEATVYDVDLDDIAKARLWVRATPTLVGARVDEEPLAPLRKDDVVLRVGTVDVAGMSPEQLDQASVAAFDGQEMAKVTVLRGSDIVVLDVPAKPRGAASSDGGVGAAPSTISVDRVRAGDAEVAVFTIHDIHDALGPDVGRAVVELKKDPKVQAIALDLRGNGGGSMDGAIDALGHFLPGLPMFPLRAAQGEGVLPDVAPKPPLEEQWLGPVASLVDSETASAAEMLAGALNAYGRGAVVGTRTFGKGCVQEYLDDDAKVGVLRLTTLLYALPDGKPVQRVGLPPTISFPFTTGSKEAEGKTSHVGPTWSGPDVRPRPLATYPTWPKLQGPFGPCKDARLCAALEDMSKQPPRRVGRK